MKLPISVLLLSSLLLSACSTSPDEEQIAVRLSTPEQLYQKARNEMAVGNFTTASETLAELDSKYPFGPLALQVQMDLIYTYYKANNAEQALATIDRFMRLNPNHADIDYVIYMRGLINMERDTNIFQELINIDRSDRDPSNSRQAFDDFKQLIQRFPESKYATDAQQRMRYIKDRLAKYEIAVARFYMERKAYIAAANRCQYVIEAYGDTSQVKIALSIMVEAYEQVGLDTLADNARKTLQLNYSK